LSEVVASVGQHPERGRKITPLLAGAKLLTRSSMGHITRLELEHQDQFHEVLRRSEKDRHGKLLPRMANRTILA
jgi:hypothetical protein